MNIQKVHRLSRVVDTLSIAQLSFKITRSEYPGRNFSTSPYHSQPTSNRLTENPIGDAIVAGSEQLGPTCRYPLSMVCSLSLRPSVDTTRDIHMHTTQKRQLYLHSKSIMILERAVMSNVTCISHAFSFLLELCSTFTHIIHFTKLYCNII